MKNILWIHSHFLYWMGGTKYICEVVKRLQKMRAIKQVTIVVEQASESVMSEFRQAGIRVISLESVTSTSPWYWLFLPWFISQRRKSIQQLLRKKKYSPQSTTIITSMFPMNVVVSGLGYKHLQLCYEPFAFFYDPDFIKHFSLVKQIFIKLIKRLYSGLDISATRDATHVLTLNKVTQSTIQEVYNIPSSLIYAGVDTKKFKPFTSSKLAEKYSGSKIAIHSTDYSPIKGTDRVIEAMRLVIDKVPSAKLLITSTIKNDLAENRLREQASSLGIGHEIEFLGFVPISELPEYYSLALVLVQGSNSARSGTTSMALPVKEAMSCGTPAVRPDVGGDDVVDGVTGFLVDPAHTSDLALAMTKLLKNPELSRRFGVKARQRIMRTYTWEKTASRIVAHL